MSLQEIEIAIEKLPPDKVQELSAWLQRHLTEVRGGEGGQDRESLKQLRHQLAAKVRKHWQGGDGLEYQQRIRAEWDDR
jgi:uncharacterized phage protein gp47/JayE